MKFDSCPYCLAHFQEVPMSKVVKKRTGELAVTRRSDRRAVAHGSRLACMEFVEMIDGAKLQVRRSPLADFEYCDLFNGDKARYR